MQQVLIQSGVTIGVCDKNTQILGFERCIFPKPSTAFEMETPSRFARQPDSLILQSFALEGK
jgi:hypothetical protein